LIETLSEEELDFVHTGPGTVAGSYLRMYWQPIYRASDLPTGKTIPIRIMSEDLTLYRGETGDIHLVAFRCAHRGTQLSVGWVEGDCIRCRYHGWMYDATGQCVEQPGEDPAFASKVRIRSYPTQVYLGLVFAYMSEGEPPPMRRYPGHERPGILETTTPEIAPCNFFNRIENLPDHVPYTHRESTIRRSGETVSYRTIYAELRDYGVEVGSKEEGPTEYYYMPNADQHNSGASDSTDDRAPRERLAWNVPIDDATSYRFRVDLVPLVGAAADEYRSKLARPTQQAVSVPEVRNEVAESILQGKMAIEDMDKSTLIYNLFRIEDYCTQVGQGAIADRKYEHLGRNDVATIAIRRLWLRELASVAAGRSLTDWRMPDHLELAEAGPRKEHPF